MIVQREVRFLFLWISVNSLSLGFSLLLSGWIEAINVQGRPNFNLTFPGFFSVVVAGLVLGLVQWKMLNEQYDIPIRWLLGTAVGLWLIAGIGSFLYSLALWTDFSKSSTIEESWFRVMRCEMIGGAIGGTLLGFMQGWSILSRLICASTNAIGWALGWSAGRLINYRTNSANWYLPGVPESIKIAVQLGILGLIAGLVSGIFTGFPLLKLLRQREQTRLGISKN